MAEWRTTYEKCYRDTDIDLYIRCPNGAGWFWSAYDAVEEDSCVSSLPGFETAEQAMQAAEQWYTTEWLPRFEKTGERSM